MIEHECLEQFGENLERMIRECGYSQRELADQAGISESTLSRYIHGMQVPRATILVNIAYVLDCSLDDLMDFGEHVIL